MPCCLSPTFLLLLDTPSWPCFPAVYLGFSSSHEHRRFHLLEYRLIRISLLVYNIYAMQSCFFSKKSLFWSHTQRGQHSCYGNHSCNGVTRFYKASRRPWVGCWLLGNTALYVRCAAWYLARHTQYIVVVLNLELILASLAIRAAQRSLLLTETWRASGIGLAGWFCHH